MTLVLLAYLLLTNGYVFLATMVLLAVLWYKWTHTQQIVKA